MLRKLTDRTILNFTLWLIILKPIFDLDWRWPLFYIGSIPIPFHRILAFIVPVMITTILVLRLFLNMPVKVNNNFPAIMFLISITITLFFQKNLYTIDEYFRSYSFFIIFLSMPSLISSTEEFHKKVKMLVLISLVPTFLSYLQTFGFLPFTYYDVLPGIGIIGRVSGGYQHPTGYLNYLLVLIPLIIYLYLNNVISKRYFWFWLLFTLPMVGRSLHRATIIVILLQLGIFIFFLRRTWFKYFMIICSIFLLTISAQHIWQFINTGESITKGQFRGRGESIWPNYITHFGKSDFREQIFGFGSPKLEDGSYEPHSDWLRIIFNYGYFGFSIYLLFLFHIFLVFFSKFLKTKREYKIYTKSLIGLILLFSIVLYSITMEPLRYSNFSWGASIVLGFVYMTIIKPKKVIV